MRAKFITERPQHPDYPLPDVDDPIMRPFWDGARDGKLIMQRDRVTGQVHWPLKPAYWKGGERLEYFEASGRGEVYTYVVGYEPFLPAFKHLLPLVMVVVLLDEGPRIVGYMVNCTPEEMRFGMRVRVVFKRLTDGVTLPVWEPDR
ncbi:MAG: OB-fold domain-containing protein [Deltaproteobacteria bacterium]|nr:OB-fold domain-containing protein [Deltaproteobacteria bacterium]MBI3387217.1 OB-fold domain-containing protein [Deltaproteobacteria bacterium]